MRTHEQSVNLLRHAHASVLRAARARACPHAPARTHRRSLRATALAAHAFAMGAGASALTADELEQMKEASKFTEEDLKSLYKKFRSIDKDGNGTLSSDEFLAIPELAANPLLERVISIFDADGNSQVDFTEFITALSTFHVGTDEEKLRFIFRVYDINADGYITNGELFKVLKAMVGNNLTEVQLQQIVDKTILHADKDGDGKISFDEFLAMVGDDSSISSKLVLQLPQS
eukprot:CAMPEP_0198313136 /NCGR_PEP_ID=MMETSP1450-20131203/4260_1 /TAXON_ID=753684 ORGANISM="Madagascaria erythrocladiodes, Strain CCMP3234" /NCGR_SAMPLE_ID=MMETSP1450 /ASSEMBLY_ACC=CAM_ASM_001115 /LENGTH=230 /DNA_ID=CAMNT_0044016115 /DNA_START=93 /DNA_END=786 /DNA_ORIENTATION=-